ncbi:hypothetical protein DFH07DRAFT_778359 [Mycena maculata]|uniref:Uncharacterized protein n=1 Tax=Mycena maculata TaxID=230809 RepID=A0AAD7N0M9_9AGAR|nr:hypothetical protein DFH07DRAFT_778359 [Mycena maculata]
MQLQMLIGKPSSRRSAPTLIEAEIPENISVGTRSIRGRDVEGYIRGECSLYKTQSAKLPDAGGQIRLDSKGLNQGSHIHRNAPKQENWSRRMIFKFHAASSKMFLSILVQAWGRWSSSKGSAVSNARGIHRKMPRHSLIGWIKFGKAGAANWNGHIDGQDHKDADKAAKSAGQTALLSEPERVSASVRAHAKKKMIVLSDEEMEEKSCCVPNCTMTEPNLPMVACSGPACDSQVHLCCVGSKAKDNIPPPEWFCDDDYGNA